MYGKMANDGKAMAKGWQSYGNGITNDNKGITNDNKKTSTKTTVVYSRKRRHAMGCGRMPSQRFGGHACSWFRFGNSWHRFGDMRELLPYSGIKKPPSGVHIPKMVFRDSQSNREINHIDIITWIE